MIMQPCPFCGGKAELDRELNADSLHIEHKCGCFLGRTTRLVRPHWGENVPENPFASWNERAAALSVKS